MSFSSKAIFTALTLSLLPVAASAQIFVSPAAPGAGGSYINGVAIPGHLQGGVQVLPGQGPIGGPVQVQGCGAAQYQSLIGHHQSAVPMPSHAAIVHPGMIRTTQYIATRLNVSLTQNGYVDRVYCG
ncbi:hypothetical protein [Jannaschia sp. CCS1]|uniref:hypothetical protein n=1 Tax=Jannaschia sp. (strain CCS1) TaxID=290400 RepID=UPI000053BBDD|nr:hypothetical protein [Jannaschia sp. CCS1]ABD52959.1 hypothetical protein Jann_0042 [Jannaschia sp. CCS1]